MPYPTDPSPPCVLVVDDYAANRMAVMALLSVDGYQVEQADCGHSALSRVAQHPPDLIVLDVMMPGIDGYDVCRRLKRNESTRLIPIIFVTALEDREALLKGIEAGGDDFITKPFDALELLARVKSLIHQKRLNEDLDHAEQVLFSIARTVESRDPHTGNHCERLVSLAHEFGQYLNLPPQHIRHLSWAGYLHDLGKVGIPDAVLLKTGPLTPEERAIMEQHVVIGEAICQPLRTMRGVVPIIRHHHERWNGTGYPDGLAGDAIPRLAQIFQVLDIFDALTHARPYKLAFSVEESLAILTQEMERGWRDPALVAQFVAFLGQRATESSLEATPNPLVRGLSGGADRAGGTGRADGRDRSL